MEIIQINKFSYFGNEHNIFFRKTDFVVETLLHISNLPYKTILISGNSDYCITDEIANNIPNNLVKWFCQNRLSNHPVLKSIPIGLDNSTPCAVSNHGYVWDHACEHIDYLSKAYDYKPTNFIYANFSIETNPSRPIIANVCNNLDYITCDIVNTHRASNLRSYKDYVNNILNHEAVVCPQGNGQGDNHRIYETLYLNRIPLTFNTEQYKYLHHNFPVVLITDNDQLKDHSWLRDQIDKAKQKDRSKLDYNYWHNLIQKEIDEL